MKALLADENFPQTAIDGTGATLMALTETLDGYFAVVGQENARLRPMPPER